MSTALKAPLLSPPLRSYVYFELAVISLTVSVHILNLLPIPTELLSPYFWREQFQTSVILTHFLLAPILGAVYLSTRWQQRVSTKQLILRIPLATVAILWIFIAPFLVFERLTCQGEGCMALFTLAWIGAVYGAVLVPLSLLVACAWPLSIRLSEGTQRQRRIAFWGGATLTALALAVSRSAARALI